MRLPGVSLWKQSQSTGLFLCLTKERWRAVTLSTPTAKFLLCLQSKNVHHRRKVKYTSCHLETKQTASTLGPPKTKLLRQTDSYPRLSRNRSTHTRGLHVTPTAKNRGSRLARSWAGGGAAHDTAPHSNPPLSPSLSPLSPLLSFPFCLTSLYVQWRPPPFPPLT